MREAPHDRVHAEFAGQRAGKAPLTWGQHGMWSAIGRHPPGFFNIPLVLAVPRRPPATVPRVVAVIGELVSRHESLRTRVVVEAGVPAQQVSRAGRLPVDVVEAEGADAATEAVTGLRARLSADTFSYPGEWPLRVGLVATSGEVSRIILVFCHIATDWQGAEVVARDIRLLLRGADLPAPELHPLDLARWQATSGLDRSRLAVDHWVTAFRAIPPTMFAADGIPEEPSHHRAVLTSRALDGAARVIAARHRVSTTTVLLAATAALVGSRTGNTTCAMRTLVNNRFQDGYAGIVGMLAQYGLLVVDLAGDPAFGELVSRTWQAALRGYRRAYYDQRDLDRALAEVSLERGAVIDPSCCFNDMRSTQDTQPGNAAALPCETTVRAALASSVVTLSPHVYLGCRFCLRVEPAVGTLTVAVVADSRCLPPVHIRGFFHDLERLVVDAAFGEVR